MTVSPMAIVTTAEARVVYTANLPRPGRAVVAVAVHLAVAHQHDPRSDVSVHSRKILLDPDKLPRPWPAVHLSVNHHKVN